MILKFDHARKILIDAMQTYETRVIDSIRDGDRDYVAQTMYLELYQELLQAADLLLAIEQGRWIKSPYS